MAIEREPGVINKFVYNGLGTSSNQTLNVGGRFFSDNYFFPKLGFSAFAGFNISSGKFITNYFLIDTAFPQIGNQRFTVNSTVGSLKFNLDSRIGITDLIKLNFGLWSEQRLFSSITQTLEFSDSSLPSKLLASGSAISSSPFRWGFCISPELILTLNPKFNLSLEPYFMVDITAVSKNVKFSRTIVGGIGVSLTSLLSHIIPKDILIDSAIQDKVNKKISNTNAEINFKINNQKSSLAVINIDRINYKNYYPFKTRYYFKEIISLNDLSSKEFKNFKINSLSKSSIIDIEKNYINILSLRLKNDTSINITLVNNCNECELTVVNKLRDYLCNNCEINSQRIIIKTKFLKFGNSFIEIQTNKQKLFSPVVIEWIVNDFTLPKISIDKNVKSDYPINYSITTLHCANKIIGRYYGLDEIKPQGFEMFISLEQGNDLPIMIAEFEVRDSLGNNKITYDTLNFRFNEKEITNNKVVQEFYFPTNENELNFQSPQSAFIDKIISNMNDSSELVIKSKTTNKNIFLKGLGIMNELQEAGIGNLNFSTDESNEGYIIVKMS